MTNIVIVTTALPIPVRAAYVVRTGQTCVLVLYSCQDDAANEMEINVNVIISQTNAVEQLQTGADVVYPHAFSGDARLR